MLTDFKAKSEKAVELLLGTLSLREFVLGT